MLCTEILIQEIVKYFMGLPFSVIRLSTPDNGVKLQITVHIMVYSECAEFDIFPCQKYPHTAIPVYSVVFVIYFRYFIKSSLFLGTIHRLPILQEVVVGIWTDAKSFQEPTNAKFMMIISDKSISL